MSYTDTDELTRGASTFMKSLRTICGDAQVLVMVPYNEWVMIRRAAKVEHSEPVFTFNGVTFMRSTL